MSVFEQLVGQNAAIAELQRAAAAARTLLSAAAPSSAPAAAMSHAWLFTGPPGSGRAVAAKTLAAALLCTGETPGCGTCAECQAAMGNNHPDVTVVSTSLVTITIDEVREYVASSYLAPASGKWRVFIVEDADRMLPNTTNVLLKAIEEPGPRTVWMLCTPAPADVLPTIRSRCRNINLVTPDPQLVADLIVKETDVTPEKALIAARAAQSHIGVARALATDPQAARLRTQTLEVAITTRGVGDAAIAAAHLIQLADSASDDAGVDAEQAEYLAALGLESGAKMPAAVRSQIKGMAEDAKKRATRRQRDTLDRELIYLISFYRDVLITQLSAQVDLINMDYAAHITRIAAATSPDQTITKLEALSQARERLRSNVAPLLALEAALVAVRVP
ncbi:MAG: DNA polymerase III subunit delta' [Trueperella sp.]|nr:DNA polymerase III subunit delta' [Trueperella sp.]